MILDVRVSTNSSKPGVEDCGEYLKVRVKAKPIGGRANMEVVKLIAGHFKARESQVTILRGAGDRRKTVEITGL